MAAHRIASNVLRVAARTTPFALGAAAFLYHSSPLGGPVLCAPVAAPSAGFVSQFPGGTPLSRKLQYLDDAREDLTISRELVFQEATLIANMFADNAHALWRAARAAYDVEQLAETPKQRKKELMDLALKWIAEAKAIERSDATVYRWSGILINEAGQFGSTADKIKNSFVVRDDWKQAVALNPYDANALHLLGRWHASVAGLSWVERKVASTLFAEPPTATYEEALDYFQKAEAASPGFWIANCWRAAEVCLKLNRKEDALQWIQKGLKLRVKGQYDLEGKKGVLQLYKQLDAAGYTKWVAEHPEEAAIAGAK